MTLLDRAGVALGTVFGTGYFPLGPGTLASLLTVLICAALGLAGQEVGLWAAAVALYLPACWAAGICARVFAQPDPGRVVIDEVVGQLITVAAVPAHAAAGVWKYWLGGFILFRVFDIVKPYPIRRLERLPGGYGIVTDDVLAGFYGYLLLRAAAWVGL